MIKKSPWVYMLSQGTCNGCELEVLACFNPEFDVERRGIKLVPSPRHADIILLTGCGTRKTRDKSRRIFEQVPEPKLAVQVGACALTGGVFKCPGPRLKGSVTVQGCPPRPTEIIKAIKKGAEKCSSKR